MPGLGLQKWQCKKCLKKRQLEPSPGAPQPPPRWPHLSRETMLQSSSLEGEIKPLNILIPIDDDIIILDGPPAPPPSGPIAKFPVPGRSTTIHPHEIRHTPPPLSHARAFTSSRSPSVTVVSIAGPRAHIAKMREQGRLAPPPTIEYKQSASGDRSELDVTAADRQSTLESAALSEAQPPAAILEEDPHNIDDLYGEIAPRFRSAPASAAASPVPAPVRRRAAITPLWYLDRDKKPVGDDEMEYICNKLAKIEKQRDEGKVPRRPRKCVATQLAGKKLRKKQERMVNYHVRDDGRGITR
ncbi:hypothetical protein L227DRAFT_616984 [Lentinus tigrinus ALCF2SS1-6]|uniref:Uncharacterized protein n=1 Tax=Lentinus tigrinus ALCF2SS1-6 TaxID=1328759 RepID=A0A5C2RPE1_9APHY|nr:hypothetical protein L227DRAFT_616984 [Lentinus tigrinus ALCF2SS1-6]